MQRNSTTLFIESENAITPVPWVNNAPNFDGFTEPTLSILIEVWETSGKNPDIIADPALPPPIPNWRGLSNEVLGGSLYPLYERLTATSFINPATATLPELGNANNIAVAAGKLDQAIAVTRIEEAVKASIDLLLTTSNYTFTTEEKNLWNTKTTELGFSDLIHLP